MHPEGSAATASKLALASVSLAQSMTSQMTLDNGILMQGWVLKKRRKRMQGFARRYFTLFSSGILSYSFHPGQPTRDQIQLNQAAISSAPGRKDIHIDSTNATFHIKCLSTDDFNSWMSVLRRFTVQDHGSMSHRASFSHSRSTPRATYHSRTGVLAEEMGHTIDELFETFATLEEEESKKRNSLGPSRPRMEKEKGREHTKEHGPMLSIFKSRKVGHAPHETAWNEHTSGSRTSLVPGTPLYRLRASLDSLRDQHGALSKLLSSHTLVDSSFSASRTPPLPSTAELEEGPHTSSAAKRISQLSNLSDGSIWYDAQEFEGAEEFVLDASPPEDSQGGKSDEQESLRAPHNDLESLGSDTDTEAGDESRTSLASQGAQSRAIRRTQLPSPPVGDEGSLFAVLKKNVGKDLSQVALPVSFNEPLTLLQRLAEELEYYELLSNAVQADNPVDRLCYVAAFAVSGYASSKHRSGRKGFNPMLAETFEDARMKFIGEKVCHNPVVLAYHAEGEGWELSATSGGKTKFWGKSLEIIPQGSTHLNIGQDHFEWTRPSSFMRNLMLGTKYLEHSGKMTIHNHTTGAHCVLEFKENGYWGPANVVAGSAFSPSGQVEALLEGKWDESLAQTLDSSHLRMLWRMLPFPRNVLESYGFTSFGITLNEITPDLVGKLPPTDSRLRPDVRALEEGHVDLAEEEKVRVEEMQRDRRRRGAEQQPRWFKQVGDEWHYTGGYWEQRARGWKHVESLW